MVRPWDPPIRNRKPKELTVFVTSNVTGAWRTAFTDALAEFNRLSKAHNLGVTMATSTTPPHPDTSAGADIQFDTGNGTVTVKAFGQTFVTQNFSGTSLHGLTRTISAVDADGSNKRIQRAFIFVPATPMIHASKHVGPKPDDFTQVQREVGAGVRRFIAVHELVHACGPENADHTVMGPGADILCDHPQPSAGPFDDPSKDRLLLHLAHPQPNVFSPPIIMKTPTANLLRNNWK